MRFRGIGAAHVEIDKRLNFPLGKQCIGSIVVVCRVEQKAVCIENIRAHGVKVGKRLDKRNAIEAGCLSEPQVQRQVKLERRIVG